MTKLQVHIHDSVLPAVRKFRLPASLGFGTVMAPVMASCTYENGTWGRLEIMPYGPILMAPNAKVLHYAQEIFEGMKAYKVNGYGPFLFRPEENAIRFNRSAKRVAMPPLPLELFMRSVSEVVAYNSDFIPGKSGESLYLRPFMFASEEALGIAPSNRYRYLVIASPCGAYFPPEAMRVFIERDSARAFPNGTGYAKTGGNYAAALPSASDAARASCSSTLWLDAVEKKYIEEMSGMNFFCVIDGRLHTPCVSDTILDGITRRSLIVLARDLGLEVIEEKIELDKLVKLIDDGACTEVFACGTAAIVSSVGSLVEKSGRCYTLKNPENRIAGLLRHELLALQEGRAVDRHEWRLKVALPPLRVSLGVATLNQ